jgi:hypothetical protein
MTAPPTTPELQGEGQAVAHDVVVVPVPVGEGVQVRLVVSFDGGDPVTKTVAVQAGEALGELGDVRLRVAMSTRAR